MPASSVKWRCCASCRAPTLSPFATRARCGRASPTLRWSCSPGAIVYRALTGRPAFASPEPAKMIFDVMYRQPEAPGDHASIHPDVNRVLALALAKRPDDRFDRAIAFAQALRLALPGALPEEL